MVTFDGIEGLWTFLCGLVLQVLFLFLPIELRNWRDDLINVLSYLAFQSFWAGILFVYLPLALNAYALSWSQGAYLFLVLGTLALLRVVQKIPLERSYPVTVEVEAVRPIAFNDLYSEERRTLIDAATAQSESNLRVEKIRSQLLRVSETRTEVRNR